MLFGEAPFGARPFGDFDHDNYANSIASALDDILLVSPWKSRSWLGRFRPRDKSSSTDPITTVDIDVSTNGHKTHPSDDEETQFIHALLMPYSMRVGLNRQLWGHAEASFAEVIIGDPDNAHRSWAGEDWVRRQCDIYLGPENGQLVEFGLVGKLLSRQVSYVRDRIKIMIDDYSFLFNQDLHTNFYSGAGGLNGGTDIQGKPRPILIGQRRQIKPILVDAVNRVYQIHDGAMESIDDVLDECDTTVYSFGVDVADITTATPASGVYDTSLATGYMKLGSDPNGVITVDAKGHNSSTYGYVNTIDEILKLLAVTFAGLTEPGEIDQQAFIALATHTAIMGEHFDTPITILDAMKKFHRSAMSYGWLKPEKLFTVGRITDPDLATADFTVDSTPGDVAKPTNQLRDDPWRVDAFEIPVGRVLVYYRKYHDVNEGDVASGVSLVAKQDFVETWRVVEAEMTSAEKVQNEQWKTIEIYTGLDLEVDAQVLADEQLALRKTCRYIGTFSPRVGLIKRGIGNVVEITDERQHTSPKNWQILDFVNEAATGNNADKIEFVCFG